MHALLNSAVKKFEKTTKESRGSVKLFTGFGLLIGYIALATSHAIDILFRSPQTSFERLYEVGENGYTASYTVHRRFRHNLQFGTLAYSLIMVTAVFLVTFIVQIFDQEQYLRPALAATHTVDSPETSDDGGGCADGDCSFGEALSVAAEGDTITFVNGLTIQTAVGFDDGLFNIATNNVTVDGNGATLEDNSGNDNETYGNSDAIQITGSGVTVTNFEIRGFGDNCIVVDATDATITDLTVQDCDYGVQINEFGNGTSISNITSTGHTLYGILDEGADNVTIAGSTLTDNTIGIGIEEGTSIGEKSTDVTITDNTISASSEYGMRVSTVDILTATDNTITDNETGVLIKNSDDVTASDNEVSNNTQSGLVIDYGVNDCTVSGNTLANNTQNGIAFMNSDVPGADPAEGCTVSSNVISGSTSGVYITYAKSLSIADNTISSNNDGVYIKGPYASYITMTGNTISDHTAVGVLAETGAKNVVIGLDTGNNGVANTFENNDGKSVYIRDSATEKITVRANTFQDGEGPIVLLDSANNGLSADDIQFVTPTGAEINGTTTVANGIIDVYSSATETNLATSYVGSAIANADGEWSFMVPAALTALAADTVYAATVTDGDGNTSPLSVAEPADDEDDDDDTDDQDDDDEDDSSEAGAPVFSFIYVTERTDQSVKVVAQTDEPTTAKLELQEAPATVVLSSESQLVHSFVVSGLQADTQYSYVVTAKDANGNQTQSGVRSLQTITVQENKVNSFELNGEMITGGRGVALQVPKEDQTYMFEVDEGDTVRLLIELLDKQSNRQAVDTVKDAQKTAQQQKEVIFKLKAEKLKLFRTYRVSTGLVGKVDTKKRITFTVLHNEPQLLFPKQHVVNGFPAQFVAYARQEAGISLDVVLVDSATGARKVSCVGVTDSTGVAICSMPFSLPFGDYELRVQEVGGASVMYSGELVVSQITSTLVTDRRSGDFPKRIITTAEPTITGLAWDGVTSVTLYPSFLNGQPYVVPITGSTGVRSWSTKWTLFPWPKGEHSIRVEQRNASGDLVDTLTLTTYSTYAAVQPAVLAVSPTDRERKPVTEPIIVSFGLPDDHYMQFFLRTAAGDRLLTEAVPSGGGVDIALNGYIGNKAGTYTFMARAINGYNLTSAPTVFTVETYKPVPVVVTPEVPVVPEEPEEVEEAEEPVEPEELEEIEESEQPVEPDEAEEVEETEEAEEEETVEPVEPEESEEPEETVEPEQPDELNEPEVDSDEDGISDKDESDLGTDPNKPDTDDDGIGDELEHWFDTDPIVFRDGPDDDAPNQDNDRLSDHQEEQLGTDPAKDDTDDDGVPDHLDPVYTVPIQDIQQLQQQVQEAAVQLFTASGQAGVVNGKYPDLTLEYIKLSLEQKRHLEELLTKHLAYKTVFEIVAGSNATVDVNSAGQTVIQLVNEFDIRKFVIALFGGAVVQPTPTTIVLHGVIDTTSDASIPFLVSSLPTFVIGTNFSTPVVQIAQADNSGRWTMTIPAEALPAGEHIVYVSGQVDGVSGAQVEVARFVIEEHRQLSNTTWLVLVNILIALVAIMVSIIVHKRNQQGNELSET